MAAEDEVFEDFLRIRNRKAFASMKLRLT